MKIGLRTIKTGVAVFFCILVSIFFNRETYVVSAITAVFTLRGDFENSLKYGRHRIAGNTFGAFSSILMIAVFKILGRSELVQLITIPLIIILLISLLAKLGFAEGSVGACATLLTILFMMPDHLSYFYALNRVVDSFIGMFIALGVNLFFPYKKIIKNK